MNIYDCETTRDLLPALARGETSPFEQAALDEHLDGCADCAADLRVVTLLQDGLDPLPFGLETRVLRAVRRAPRRRWQRNRLALAATVAFALIGGSFVVQRTGYFRPVAPAVVSADFETAAAASWDADADPLLHGASQLQQLSEDELELLLAELES